MGDHGELVEPRGIRPLVVVPRFRQTLLYVIAFGLLVALVIGDILLIDLRSEITRNRHVYCQDRPVPACRDA